MRATRVIQCFSHRAVAIAAVLASSGASAATLTVGAAGSGCNHLTVQAALNAAIATPESDVIRITRSATYTQQEISFNSGNQEIELTGGFASCTATVADNIWTRLSGAGGGALPVLTVRGNGVVRLRKLEIINGDAAGNGGGIDYEGNGILDIANATIASNEARDGGGIYATGTGILAEVVLGENVSISSNTARNSGGGMVAKDLEASIIGPATILFNNRALGQNGGGTGGGLVVVSEARSAYGYVRSNGIGGLGVISNNSAVFGGGIAVLRSNGDSDLTAEVRVYATSSNYLARINGNSASNCGGGIYLRGSNNLKFDEPVRAILWRAALNDNIAPEGSASCQHEDQSVLAFTLIAEAANCTPGRACNEIHGNSTQNAGGAATQGATLRNRGGRLFIHRTSLRFNQGGRLYYAGEEAEFESYFANSLIADNLNTLQLIRFTPNSQFTRLDLIHVTVAGNSISAPEVIFSDRDIRFNRSLFNQPGNFTINNSSSGDRDAVYTLTNNLTNMPNAQAPGGANQVDPRFVDPANGNYGLRAGSRAIDRAPVFDPGNALLADDFHGFPHTFDMPINGTVPDFTADIGALERPALQPLVLNSNFDLDLRMWDFSAESTWDGTQNAAGGAGSGSARVPVPIDGEGRSTDPLDQLAPLAIGRTQCLHLPGPGRYALNGFGRVSDGLMLDNNRVQLRWALRYSGLNGGCASASVPASTGVLQLATNSTWRRPPTPTEIVVDAALFTGNTAIVVSLETRGSNFSPPTGWFDGITLEPVVPTTDSIFLNGFEQ
jgi:parallel beta-helix repeat protein